MKWRALGLMVAIVSMLFGCSTVYDLPGDSSENAALISGDRANFLTFSVIGDAHVFILEVDGIPVGKTGACRVSPGKHQIKVGANNNYKTASKVVDLTLGPNRKYKFKVKRKEMLFTFDLFDVSAKKEVKVETFSATATSLSRPVTVPIII